MTERVLIIDFGSQYTQLIARRVRELQVYSEIIPFHAGVAAIRHLQPRALILSGGPASVYAPGAPRLDKELLQLGIPILGICYGLQLLAFLSGLRVQPAKEREYGPAQLEIKQQGNLLRGVPDQARVWMSHGDKIAELPPDFSVTARTANTEYAVIEAPARKIFGVQFHPEVAHTAPGKQILANFLFDIAGLRADWSMASFLRQAIANVREQVGAGRVILGLSGGVDSTVLALLLQKAVGQQVTPVLVNTGLMRKNEYESLLQQFHGQLGLHVEGLDAKDMFLRRLQGVNSPEKKRKIIGKAFIHAFAEAEKKVGRCDFFAQGTLYPDVIESVSVRGPSATIKSHHNVGGLPQRLKWRLLEPLRDLFKDEVRELGRQLDLPEAFIRRHPFPGPGLAVRILGAVTVERLRKLQDADAILIEELHRFGIYDKPWQAFVVLLPVRSVGVMGDERTYENAVVLRMVESVDGMTADCFPAPYDFLRQVAGRIVNEVKGINRVAYDITSKPPATIEWE